MPRQPRLDSPGLLHHVIAHGIERNDIFRFPDDYQNFLTRLERSVEKDKNQILAWALMSNHFHLLVRSGSGGLVRMMRRLMTGYAVSFNTRYKRSGHLFRNRYKSIVCEEDTYLLELVRYIHLNPLRAGIVRSLNALAEYPYTGHSVLMGRIHRSWQETSNVLERFGTDIKDARLKYQEFIQQGLKTEKAPDLLGGGLIRSLGGFEQASELRREQDHQLYDSRVLGSGGFVQELLKEAEDHAKQRANFNRCGIDLRWAAREIAQEMKIKERSLFLRGRTNDISKAKAMLIYLGIEVCGQTRQTMAEMTRMSGPAATQAKGIGIDLLASSRTAKMLDSYLVTNVP